MMKRSLIALLFMAIVNCNQKSEAQDYSKDELYVYLCIGQSNMEGAAKIEEENIGNVDPRFMVLQAINCPALGREQGKWYSAEPPLVRCGTGIGPIDYFGREMVAKLPNHIKVGVINIAIGGCKIELFDKDNYQTYVDSSPDWLKNMVREYDDNPYARLIELAKIAQKDGAIIKGVLLHQGESNAGDAEGEWTNKVKKVYDNILIDLDLDPTQVPLLAGEVVIADGKGVCLGMNKVIATLPSVIPNTYIISSENCGYQNDNLHFNVDGYVLLGKRYAECMLSLLNNREFNGE